MSNRRGGGKWVFVPAGESPATAQARDLFLRMVSRDASVVEDTLYEQVLPSFRRATEAAADRGIPLPDWRELCASGASLDQDLSGSLHDWASPFHLDADWVLDAAVRTLSDYCASGARRWASHGYLVKNPIDPEKWAFRFYHAGWDVTKSDRVPARREIEARFKERLRAHLDELDRLALEAGGVQAPETRGKAAQRHLKWLVHWQCLGKKKDAICEHFDIAMKTLNSGLRDAAASVGLELR